MNLNNKNLSLTQPRADFIIALISMAWGTSYLFMKIGLNGLSPFNLISLRFGIAFILLLLIFNKRLKNIDKNIIKYGAVLGIFVFGTFSFLLYGMKTTTASTAGFLNGTTVILVPIIISLLSRKRPEKRTVISCLVTLFGISFLTIQTGLSFNFGSVLCLIGAVFNSLNIIFTNRFSKKCDGLMLGIMQIGFAALYGTIFMLIFEKPSLPDNTYQWIAVLGLAVLCSAFGYSIQPVAQKFTTPEHTGLLFSLEPIFSAIFA